MLARSIGCDRLRGRSGLTQHCLAVRIGVQYQIEESAVAVHYIEHVLLIDQTTVVEEIRRKLDTVLASVQEARCVHHALAHRLHQTVGADSFTCCVLRSFCTGS